MLPILVRAEDCAEKALGEVSWAAAPFIMLDWRELRFLYVKSVNQEKWCKKDKNIWKLVTNPLLLRIQSSLLYEEFWIEEAASEERMLSCPSGDIPRNMGIRNNGREILNSEARGSRNPNWNSWGNQEAGRDLIPAHSWIQILNNRELFLEIILWICIR